ncbi:hypothetical protein D3C80_1506190 [compost metagenome]
MLSEHTQQLIFTKSRQFRQLAQCNSVCIMILYVPADPFNLCGNLPGRIGRTSFFRILLQQLLQQKQQQFLLLKICLLL